LAREPRTKPTHTTRFAGFWRRGAALIVDLILINGVVFVFAIAVYEFGAKQFVPRLPLFWHKTTTKSYTPKMDSEEYKRFERLEVSLTTYYGRWNTYLREKVRYSSDPSVSATDSSSVEVRSKKTISSERLIPNEGTKKLEPAFVIFSDQVSYLLLFIYFAIFEASNMKGTVGKRILRLVVTDYGGHKLTFSRSILRNVTKVFSLLLLAIGFIMAAFTKKKQGLHDFAAKTYVLQRVPQV